MICPRCGASNNEGDNFCITCGNALNGTSNNNTQISDNNMQPNNQMNAPMNNMPQPNYTNNNQMNNMSQPNYIVSTEDNIAMGIVGAILGSLAGAVAIILLDRIGYVASVSGVLMAVCTLSLYEKFAKGISKKGIIICVVVMTIMTFLAVNFAYSISIAEEFQKYGFDVSTMDVFKKFFELLSEDIIDTGKYILSLVMVYLFTAAGAYGIIYKKFKLSPNQKSNF